ncbi:MAG: mandelate racemase/muconate lactonizing enzyme family protein [bacterium]|nr:mandelate racemase/muconate lactonizing enzyme family protein [bacterium]
MKIRDISTFILRVPLGEKRFYSSQCAFPERNSFLVRIETDEGLVGWGEGGQYGPPEPVAACVNAVLAPLIIGEDAGEPIKLWEKMYAHTRDFGQKGSYIEAISAIDVALWDISGKSLNVPVYRLLGGAFRDSVAAYATGGYYTGQDYLELNSNLESLAKEAASYRDAGFKVMKIKIGLLSVEEDVQRVAAMKEAVGADMRILVDANHAYNVSTAIRIGKQLEQYDVGWIEEPVTPEDREGYRRIRQEVNIPIAGGECEYTRYGFRDFLAGGCVDIAQPDISVCGGLSEFMKIQALASSFGVWVIPHVWGSGVAIATALHAIATIPPFPHTANPIPLQNEPVIEFDRSPNPLRDELLTTSIALVESRLPVPQGAGLGIEIDETVLQKYSQH